MLSSFTLVLTWFGLADRERELENYLFSRLEEDYIVDSVKSILFWDIVNKQKLTYDWLMELARKVCDEVMPPEPEYERETELVF